MAEEHSSRFGSDLIVFRAGSAVSRKLPGVAACLAATAAPAMAAQPHGNPAGVVAYPLSHLFFIASMAILIGWLSRRGVAVRPGWREIRYSAIFFILWSAFAVTAYLLEDQSGWIAAGRIGSWTLHIEPAGGNTLLAWIYYLVRLDHLHSVPAMGFLVLGLTRLLAQSQLTAPDENDPACDPAGDGAEGKREDGV